MTAQRFRAHRMWRGIGQVQPFCDIALETDTKRDRTGTEIECKRGWCGRLPIWRMASDKHDAVSW
jgi:hypothetical protein